MLFVLDSQKSVRNDEADISFNSRFLLDYNEEAIEFLFPVFADRFCIIAPAALEVPGWQLMFIPFKPNVWLWLFTVNTLCAIFWHFLVQRKRSCRNVKSCITDFENILLYMSTLMFSVTLPNLPKRAAERVFLAFCLIFNVVVFGTFQV